MPRTYRHTIADHEVALVNHEPGWKVYAVEVDVLFIGIDTPVLTAPIVSNTVENSFSSSS